MSDRKQKFIYTGEKGPAPEEEKKRLKGEDASLFANTAEGKMKEAEDLFVVNDGDNRDIYDTNFVDMKEGLKKLIDDDLLFDSMIASRNIIIQQKISKGETPADMYNLSTVEEMGVTKEGAIEQFSSKFTAITTKTINDIARDIRDEHGGVMREYSRKKNKLKGLVDSCTEHNMWANFLLVNKDAIMLQKKCEVLQGLAEELENKI